MTLTSALFGKLLKHSVPQCVYLQNGMAMVSILLYHLGLNELIFTNYFMQNLVLLYSIRKMQVKATV